MNILKVICSLAAVSATSSLLAGPIPFQSGDKIAFLGDSITELGTKNASGYVNLVMDGLKRSGINATLVPAGVSGNQCIHMIKRLDKDVISKKPQWMFLSCGVNDANNGMDNPGIPLETYKKTIGEILDKCKKAQINVIILTATPVVEETEHVANKNLVPYNEFLRTLAKERNLPVIDLNQRVNTILAKKPDPAKRYLTVDGTHMNPRGDVLLAYTILESLGADPVVLTECVGAWLTDQKAWRTKLNLDLSIDEMEKLEKKLPAGMTVEQWVNDSVRKELAK